MIYFDNAATTYPKPERVYRKTVLSMRECGGNPGRGAHELAMLAEEEVFNCRIAAAEMFGASPENVIFTLNTTYALNIAIKSAYSGGAIIMSDLEHNSVLRPSSATTNRLMFFNSHTELQGEERKSEIINSLNGIIKSMPPDQRKRSLIVSTAASNICSADMPIREIGQVASENRIHFIVDGAQAGGVYDLSLEKDNIDTLCLPGHKGLYGPQGIGMMIIKQGSFSRKSFIEGGSGVNSASVTMPDFPPERFEAGTLPVSAIAGLREGLNFVKNTGCDKIREKEKKLSARLAAGLKQKFGDEVIIYADSFCGGILLFNFRNFPSSEAAAWYDQNGICIRSGLHCAPLAHRRIGTADGGAIRVSFGYFNTEREVDRFLDASGFCLKYLKNK